MDHELARGARLRPAGRGALRPAVARQALARVPLAGRPAARVHPAVAAQGRPGAPARAVAARRQPRDAAATTRPRCACPGCALVHDRPGRAPLRQRRRAAAGGGRRRAARAASGTTRSPRSPRRASTRAASVVVEDGPPERARPGVAGAGPDLAHRGRPRASSTCAPTAAGMLVVSDAWAPGWQATVDGRPADVERVDYLFRGVRVARRHATRVEFTYRPLSWRIGWIVSLLALVGAGRRAVEAQVKGRRPRARRRAGDRRAAACSCSTPSASGRAASGDGRGIRPWVGRAGRRRADLLPALGLPALPPVRGAARVRHRRVRAAARRCGSCPAYWVALTVAAIVLPLHEVFRRNVPPFYGFAQVYDDTTVPAGLGQAWTLCVEVAFYAFLPLWALLIGRTRRAVAAGRRCSLRERWRTKCSCSALSSGPRRAAGPRADRAARLPGLSSRWGWGWRCCLR